MVLAIEAKIHPKETKIRLLVHLFLLIKRTQAFILLLNLAANDLRMCKEALLLVPGFLEANLLCW